MDTSVGWDGMGAALGSEEEEEESKGNRYWERSSGTGWENKDGSENMTHLPGAVRENKFMCCQGGGKEERGKQAEGVAGSPSALLHFNPTLGWVWVCLDGRAEIWSEVRIKA